MYHSFSFGRTIVAPGLRVILLALLGVGVPPRSVYAPVSVLPGTWPLLSQLAKRIALYQVT